MAKPTKEENNYVAKTARRACAKSPLDISRMNIACTNGSTITLTGIVKAPPGNTGLNVRTEFETLKNMIQAVSSVREVYGDQVKFQ